MTMRVADVRREYGRGGLAEADLAADPIEQFKRWLDQAMAADPQEFTAMTLATADGAGRPSARVVLLKGVDERGFVFYTDYGSRKGRELVENPRAALVFYWAPLDRQVRVEGADGLQLDTPDFTLKKGGNITVRVTADGHQATP